MVPLDLRLTHSGDGLVRCLLIPFDQPFTSPASARSCLGANPSDPMDVYSPHLRGSYPVGSASSQTASVAPGTWQTGLSAASQLSPAPRRFDLGYIDLAHFHHRSEGALCLVPAVG